MAASHVVSRILLGLILLGAAHSALGQPTDALLPEPEQALAWTLSWERFTAGWAGFTQWEFLIAQLLEFALTILLASAIAFHPRNFRSGLVTHIDLLDQPKTLLVYAMVATMVYEIVQVYPAMAFVVFGIGGLMRFRTDLGMPKLTGRAILVTVIGLAVGLELFPLAILGTAIAWVLIYLLETHASVELRVRKLPEDRTDEALELWEELLAQAGGQVVTAVQNHTARQIEFLLVMPVDLDRKALQQHMEESIPKELRGKVEVTIA